MIDSNVDLTGGYRRAVSVGCAGGVMIAAELATQTRPLAVVMPTPTLSPAPWRARR